MTNEQASTQPSRNFRQTLEGMPLFFNPAAAEGMNADIQFNAGGREPGIYAWTLGRAAQAVKNCLKPPRLAC